MRPPNILIVDDDPDNLTVLRNILTAEGFKVRPAINGEIALNALKESPSDIVLLDVMMPGMDGFEVCSQIKSDEKLKEIPVMFITALGHSDDKIKGFGVGGVDYITKPFQAAEVIARIKTHLNLKDAKEKAIASHSMLSSILHNIPDTIIAVDTSMQIINSNTKSDQTCEHLDIKKVENLSTMNPSYPCQQVLLQTLKSGENIRDYRVECKNMKGKHKTEVLSTASLLDHNQNRIGAILIIRDISKLAELEAKFVEKATFRNIVGNSKKLQQVLSIIERISELDINVLVSGESGTGKELIADAIHFSSNRAEGPLVKVNCAALSETLLESELFGHVRGAFTGAIKDRIGRFQLAEGGTLFLDEIGDISPVFQAKLLRFLEQKEFERLGDSQTLKADVRIICATNQDLKAKIETKEFREDLYYRLKGAFIHLPALRERLEDLSVLIQNFLLEFSKMHHKDIRGISKQVLQQLQKHSWPGNIRELKSVIEYASAICTTGTIEIEDLPHELKSAAVESNQVMIASDPQISSEKETIVAVLKQFDGNKAKTARNLGISRGTLYNRMNKLGIQ